MKITKVASVEKVTSLSERIQKARDMRFTVELSGLELVALGIVASMVSGDSELRSVFSWRGYEDGDNFYKAVNADKQLSELSKTLAALCVREGEFTFKSIPELR